MKLPSLVLSEPKSTASEPPDTTGALWSRWPFAIFLVLFAGAMALYTVSLGHTAIAPWDESVHAVVAEHIALHPLQPTLYEVAALTPPVTTNWSLFHIWLHIPPLGLWASALSMRLLGDTPFAFRLPGVVFVGLGMLVTYVLGHRLYGPLAAIIGAAFVGFAPYPLLVGQGYVFGDMTDVPLMLFTPLAVLALVQAYRTGRYRWLVIAGVSQGLCYLAKGGFGLAPAGVLLALYVCERLFPDEPGWQRLGLRGLGAFAGSAILIAAPFNIYTQRVFPAAASIEASNWKTALFTNYEGWGRPLDYHFTTYLYAMYGPALALVLLSAGIVVAVHALSRRSRADIIAIVWIAALYIPLSLAVTKAVPFTYAAVPAVGLVFGRFVALGLSSRALLARAGTLGLLLGAVGTACLLRLGHFTRFETPYHVIMPVQFFPEQYADRASLYGIEFAVSAMAGLLCALVIWAIRSRTSRDATQADSMWHELRENVRGLLTRSRDVLAAAKPASL
ncbi:MAG TPA: glycosyltransferase family 39 protein, partial [Ktedonobacterales bacterium]|nr:glycosyltransferase family 39 protein [Ktedonobacterales bacterium]